MPCSQTNSVIHANAQIQLQMLLSHIRRNKEKLEKICKPKRKATENQMFGKISRLSLNRFFMQRCLAINWRAQKFFRRASGAVAQKIPTYIPSSPPFASENPFPRGQALIKVQAVRNCMRSSPKQRLRDSRSGSALQRARNVLDKPGNQRCKIPTGQYYCVSRPILLMGSQ